MKNIGLKQRSIQLKSDVQDIGFIIFSALMAATFGFLYLLLLEKQTEKYTDWKPEEAAEAGITELDRAA